MLDWAYIFFRFFQMDLADIISFFAKFLEGTGVLVITIGVLYSLVYYLYHLQMQLLDCDKLHNFEFCFLIN